MPYYLQYEITNLPPTDSAPWVDYIARTVLIPNTSTKNRDTYITNYITNFITQMQKEYPENNVTPLRTIFIDEDPPNI